MRSSKVKKKTSNANCRHETDMQTHRKRSSEYSSDDFLSHFLPQPIRMLNIAGGVKESQTSEYGDETDESEQRETGQRSKVPLTQSQAEEQKGLVRVNGPGLLSQERRDQPRPRHGGRGEDRGASAGGDIDRGRRRRNSQGCCAGKRKWKEEMEGERQTQECAENQRRTAG